MTRRLRLLARSRSTACRHKVRVRSTSGGSAASTTRAKGPALLGFGERESAGLLFGDRGPERAVAAPALDPLVFSGPLTLHLVALPFDQLPPLRALVGRGAGG